MMIKSKFTFKRRKKKLINQKQTKNMTTKQHVNKQQKIEIFTFLGHRLTWTAYHRVADIYSFIDYMAATYPDLCSTFTIGYSVERRPLKVLK